jgi:hypothetical protein
LVLAVWFSIHLGFGYSEGTKIATLIEVQTRKVFNEIIGMNVIVEPAENKILSSH